MDVRGTDALKEGIIENSICVGFDGPFANWVGTVFNPTDKFVIYGTEEQAKESITRLFRIGYINILGHANFSLKAWKEKGYPVSTPDIVYEVIQPNTTVLDVRKPGEWKEGIVEGATLYELNDVYNHVPMLLFSLKNLIKVKSTLSTADLDIELKSLGVSCYLPDSRPRCTLSPSNLFSSQAKPRKFNLDIALTNYRYILSFLLLTVIGFRWLYFH